MTRMRCGWRAAADVRHLLGAGVVVAHDGEHLERGVVELGQPVERHPEHRLLVAGGDDEREPQRCLHVPRPHGPEAQGTEDLGRAPGVEHPPQRRHGDGEEAERDDQQCDGSHHRSGPRLVECRAHPGPALPTGGSTRRGRGRRRRRGVVVEVVDVVDDVVVEVEVVEVVVPAGCVVRWSCYRRPGGRRRRRSAALPSSRRQGARGVAFGAGTPDGVTWNTDTVAWTRPERRRWPRGPPASMRRGRRRSRPPTARRSARADPRCARRRGSWPRAGWSARQRARGGAPASRAPARATATATRRPSGRSSAAAGLDRRRWKRCGQGRPAPGGVPASAMALSSRSSPAVQ